MRLTHDTLLRYQGILDFDGICHLRVYEQDGRRPVAIAGQLVDNPGSGLSDAITLVAAAIKREVLSDGREFELVEHHPDSLWSDEDPTFELVEFSHAHDNEEPEHPDHNAGRLIVLDQTGRQVETFCRTIGGDFRCPRWRELPDIEALVGCHVRTWPKHAYTTRAVAGLRGELCRRTLALRNRQIVEQLEGQTPEEARRHAESR